MLRILIILLFISGFKAGAQSVVSVVENQKIVRTIKVKKNDSIDQLLYSFVEKYRRKGFLLSSIDSIFKQNDTLWVVFFRGNNYFFGEIRNSKTNEIKTFFKNKTANLNRLDEYFEKKISLLNNSGYPFAKLSISNIEITAKYLNVDYFIDTNNYVVYDSLYFNPKVRISQKFLQNFLYCQHKKGYNQQNIEMIDKRIQYINCLQIQYPSQLEFHKNSVDLYLYIINKKASSFSGALALELKDKKIQLLGQADIRLINSFRTSDEISLHWNKISSNSQMISSYIDIPYIFGTKIGFANKFDFRQLDTSLFTVANSFYFNYFVIAFSRISFLYQFKQNVSFDTLVWGKSLKQNLFGLSMYNTTVNDLYCPTKGIDYKINISIAPNQKEKKVFLLDIFANYYFQLGKRLIFKASTTNLYYKSDEIQKNEFYSIGGANLLRGFEQNAFMCSSYSVNTTELRWIFAKYSFIGFFGDFAFFKEYEKNTKLAKSIGLTFQINTKQTIFSVSIALGSVDKQKMDLRQTKIHFKISNFL